MPALVVIPAQAGIHNSLILMDSRLRGNDGVVKIQTFYEFVFCIFISEGLVKRSNQQNRI